MSPFPISSLPFKKRPVFNQTPKSGRWSSKKTLHPTKAQSTGSKPPNRFKTPPAKLGNKRIEETEKLTRDRRSRPLEWIRSSALGMGFRGKMKPKFNFSLTRRLKSFWERVTKGIQEENLDEILEQAVENVELSNLGCADGEYDETDDEIEWPRVYEQDEPTYNIEATNPFPPTIGFWRPF